MKSIYFLSKFEAFLFLLIICLLIAGDLLFLVKFFAWFLSASSDWLFIGCLYGVAFFAFFNSMIYFLYLESKETI